MRKKILIVLGLIGLIIVTSITGTSSYYSTHAGFEVQVTPRID